MEQLVIRSVRTSSTAVGSRSMNEGCRMQDAGRRTCLLALVSEKKILNALSLVPIGLSDRICPSVRLPG
jgi:hypothetical protein